MLEIGHHLGKEQFRVLNQSNSFDNSIIKTNDNRNINKLPINSVIPTKYQNANDYQGYDEIIRPEGPQFDGIAAGR